MRLSILGLLLAAFPAFGFDSKPPGSGETTDLPASKQMRNVGGSDGAGLCVPTSITHAALWQNLKTLEGYRAYCQTLPGGSWPEKTDQTLAAYCKKKGVQVPEYIQHTGGDIEFLELALKTDRMVGVTYCGVDGFYSGPVAHMVNLVYLDHDKAAILDNNRPGEIIWMTRNQFRDRWLGTGYRVGGGWAFVFLAPPPPPYRVAKTVADNPNCRCPECKCEKCECTIFRVEQCGPNGCSVPLTVPASSGWQQSGDGWKYWESGKLKGYLDSNNRWHTAASNDSWYSAESPLPYELPVESKPSPYLTGVDWEKVDRGHGYSKNGRNIPKHEAFSALNSLLDDSNKYHLTFVGDPEKLKAAEVALANRKDLSKFHVQLYAPTDWAVSQFSLPTGWSLREPSPEGRYAAQIGTADTLDELLKLLEPVLPVTPPAPPAPTDPVWPDWVLWVIGIGIFYYLFLYPKGDSK